MVMYRYNFPCVLILYYTELILYILCALLAVGLIVMLLFIIGTCLKLHSK